MAQLREKVPQEFSDDERWYKFFTRKSLLMLILSCGLAAGIIALFSAINLLAIGIIFGLALGVCLFYVTTSKAFGKEVLTSTDATMDVVALRTFTRKRNGRIYVNFHPVTKDKKG